ncbi:MAG: hypothetical protein WA902_14280 [Thermosynechococcaceae cyanobacterium]
MALLLVTALSLGACQKSEPTPASPPSATPQAAATQTDPGALDSSTDEWVETETTEIIPVVDALGQHLHQARLSFEKQDNQKAAVQIKQAAAFLIKEKGRASLEGQSNIDEAVEDLNAFADMVKDGKITSIKALDPVFAQAYQADIENLWVVATEEQWVPIVEKSEYYWRSAHDAFIVDDNLDAAKDIHKGVAFLKLRSHHFRGAEKQALMESANTLQTLAEQVQKGEVKDVAVLDKAFAKEHLMVAKADASQAGQDVTGQKTKEAGYALKAAAHNLEAAAKWVQKESVVQSTVIKTREMAEGLVMGDQKDTSEINQVIKVLEETNQTLSQQLV